MSNFLRAFALVWLTALAACQSPTTGSGEIKTATAAPKNIVPVGAFCALAQPIYWSRQDTPETILSVKEHNAVGVKLCGWKGSSR